jgi:hypothetical protein
VNYDDSVLYTTNVIQGQNAVYVGAIPTKPNTTQYTYAFTGWDRPLTNVFSTFTTKARFSTTTNTYTVIWQNHNGTTLETDTNVPYGTTPTYNGSTPTKTGDNDYNFAFNGWLPVITSVTANVTYVAQFNQNLNYIPITNSQELDNIRINLSGNYRLMNDIDLESLEWQPIGTFSAPFTGTLDGQNFTINNLKITVSTTFAGFIGVNRGLIQNLKLSGVNISINGPLSDNVYVGSFIGYNDSSLSLRNLSSDNGSVYLKNRGGYVSYVGGVIGQQRTSISLYNIHNNLSVTGIETSAVGGLVGQLDDFTNGYSISIYNSSNSGFISGVSKVGGIIGSGINTVLNNSRNLGNINCTNSYCGGLMGYSSGYSSFNKLLIENSLNYGLVISNSSNVGGLVGYAGNYPKIFNSINYGDISGNSSTGGIIGFSYYTEITYALNFGKITTIYNNSGGIIGSTVSLKLEQSLNHGVVSGKENVGGLVGQCSDQANFQRNLTINKSYNLGEIKGENYVGGFLGKTSTNILLYINNSLNLSLVKSFGPWGFFVGFFPSLYDDNNNYYFDAREESNNQWTYERKVGTKVTDLSTFNIAFFTTTLGWDTEVWDFTGLDIAKGVYPTLKNMPVVED